MKSLGLWFGALIALVAQPALADGSLSSYPSSDACAAERTAGLVAGYEVGLADGNAQGFTRGQVQGWNEAVAYCIANPAMCGIAFASCLPAPTYGETEPNDNIVAANALPFDVGFWGQSYGPVDKDWFYIVTTQPNQNLTINFSVPNGSIFGYKVAIRDAAGNLFADFDTSAPGSVPAPEGEVAYRVTLGFVGAYYIVVETAPGVANYSTYNLAAVLQDSPLDAQNYIVGFYDVELEPNDLPAASTMLTTGVTMYGLINLSFDQTVPTSDGTSVWAQGSDSDWYGYYSSGSEVVTLTFCAREQCEPGNWQVEVYGTDETNDVVFGSGTAKPILSINTDTTSTSAPLTYRMGLPSAGMYYMRVNHKRLYTAPCAQYDSLDLNSDGDTTDPDETKSCSCTGGKIAAMSTR